MPDARIIRLQLKRFTFMINCEGSLRTVTIAAETQLAAVEKAIKENPGCEIRFLWAHD